MNELKIFKNEEFGQVRVLEKDGEPWFVAKDACDILEIKNTTDAVKRLDVDEVTRFNLGSLSGETNLVNEYGLYSLILGSRKQEAKNFKRWITHEVIPSIRKSGGYIANQENLTPEQIMANAVIVAQNIIKQKDKLLDEQRPKVIFADAVSVSHTDILVGDLAKLLKQNGIEVGANRLFAWMRNNKYLISRNGTDYNMPSQKSMELELYRVKETTIMHPDGHTSINKTPKVTGKGQQYFINKFLDKYETS